jgi:hypothetical protein
MPEKIDIEKIIKKNPSISPEEIEKNRLLTEELRKEGIQPHGYRLAPPFLRRRAKSVEEGEPDPRTINLTASRYKK